MGWLFPVASVLVGPGGEPLEWGDIEGVLYLYGVLLSVGLILNIGLIRQVLRHPPDWRRAARRLTGRPWHAGDVAFILLVVCGFNLALVVLLRVAEALGWMGGAGSAQHIWIVGHSVALHWGIMALIGFLVWRKRISWSAAFEHRGGTWKGRLLLGLVGYLAAVPLLIFYSAIYHVWLQWIGYDYAPQEVMQVFAEMEPGLMMGYMVVLAVGVAPLSEELLFRGVMLPLAARRIGIGGGIALTSILFAGIHFHVSSFVPLVVFSVLLSLAYCHTRTIWVPVIMHMLFNAVSLTVMWMLG